jgi:hypothetical protein
MQTKQTVPTRRLAQNIACALRSRREMTPGMEVRVRMER